MSTNESAMERWRRISEQQEQSGLSVAAYCRQHQVAESSLFSWKRRLRGRQHETAAAPAFVEVQAAPPAQAPSQASQRSGVNGHDEGVQPGMRPSGAIELHLRDRRRLVLRRGFDPQTLRQVLAVLKDLEEHPDPENQENRESQS